MSSAWLGNLFAFFREDWRVGLGFSAFRFVSSGAVDFSIRELFRLQGKILTHDHRVHFGPVLFC